MSQFIDSIISLKKSFKKGLAVLIDPDQSLSSVQNIAQICEAQKVDYIFVGGSIITEGELNATIKTIKYNFSGLKDYLIKNRF